MSAQDERHREAWQALLKNRAEMSERSWKTALILSVLLGFWGADRFYVRRPILGTLKLITAGGGGVWWLADIVVAATGNMTDGNGRKIVKQTLKNTAMAKTEPLLR